MRLKHESHEDCRFDAAAIARLVAEGALRLPEAR